MTALTPTAPTTAPREHEPLSRELRRELKKVQPWDFPLLAAVVLLLGLGAVMVYSATINEMTQLTGDGMGKLKTHLLHMSVGIGLLVFFTFFRYERLKPLVYPALVATVGLLVLVIVAGFEAGNARRWIALPGFNVQPVEVAKVSFVLFLSYSLAKKGGRIRQFTVAFIPHFMVAALLIFLCLFQPDFGTSVILVILMFTMLFVAGTRLSYLTLFFFVGSFLAFQAIASNDMRLGRVMASIDPWAHRMGRGFQMVNSQIAIGSGGVFGQGLGYGGQTITGFLPEGETDFILSVTAEQLGALGLVFVSFLFSMILVRGMKIARATEDAFGRYLAFGLTLLLTLQVAINMLVAVALIPTKGLTLPFVSYGGSSMLMTCATVGILLNISRSHGLKTVRQYAPEPEKPAPAPKTRRQQQQSRFSLKSSKRPKAQTLDEVLR
ncbi:MAG: cell division protein FtsW [Myxococcales bacterium]|nr:cell division protein FtsW [Myxococcales bacterium]MCB9731340.1 cell division protein FtsW [Deltaproteobacteria bacterium]